MKNLENLLTALFKNDLHFQNNFCQSKIRLTYLNRILIYASK